MFDLISNPDSFTKEFSYNNYIIALETKRISSKLFSNNAVVNNVFYYLEDLECNEILIEEKYNDKFFLDSYLNFYGSCFQEINRFCKRLHFFKKVEEHSMSAKELLKLILLGNEEQGNYIKILQEKYLGFIVGRPIPSVIGRTIIKTPITSNSLKFKQLYSENLNKAQLYTIKKYEANIFGIPLQIKTLSFQGQDTTISACATSALRVVLEKTSADYGYYMPTAFEITQKASEIYPVNRAVPSSGLTSIQIINTINNYGLEAEIIDLEKDQNGTRNIDKNKFLATCYAYLKTGFPIFLALKHPDGNFHAVAVLGYDLSRPYQENQEIPMISTRIANFYIHDDIVGPFTPYNIKDNLELSFLEDISNEHSRKSVDQIFIIIALYKKIRYPFKRIYSALATITNLVINDIVSNDEKIRDQVEWDCHLTSVNYFKKFLLENQYGFDIEGNYRELLLRGFFPRFIWRSTLIINQVPVFELLGDATLSPDTMPFFSFIPLNSIVRDWFKELFNTYDLTNFFQFSGLYEFLKKEIETWK